jgi:hypothetical protein
MAFDWSSDQCPPAPVCQATLDMPELLETGGRHQFMYNESLELTAPQHTAVKT